MQPTTSLLINSTRKALKLLQRDFFELEMIQSSNKGLSKFCDNSYLRTKQLLHDELSRYYKSIIYVGDDEIIDSSDEVLVLVQPTDSLENLARSLPFFAVMITCFKRINNVLTATNSIMNFPILNEVYYAEKGSGAWVDKNNDFSSNSKANRLRVHNGNNNNVENLIAAGSDLQISLQLARNVRYTGSLCFEMAMFIAGKIDILNIKNLDSMASQSFELFVREAGGIITAMDDYLICSNPKLVDKLKQ